jgi:hypothetical protein
MQVVTAYMLFITSISLVGNFKYVSEIERNTPERRRFGRSK